jgi:hypothetical protein
MSRPVPNTQEYRQQCLCPGCPTYPQLQGDKAFYCSLGTTDRNLNRENCLCPTCHTWFANHLENDQPSLYFCLDPIA